MDTQKESNLSKARHAIRNHLMAIQSLIAVESMKTPENTGLKTTMAKVVDRIHSIVTILDDLG